MQGLREAEDPPSPEGQLGGGRWSLLLGCEVFATEPGRDKEETWQIFS